ncbi:unnamed protein product [Anisakis simplex]|uniref:7TM_GPCR_Srx domain-containing protein n=1 Tax=Anisakis simplex TaxID=6269 RepID=A0A0M3JMR4_ANISI|nr:unnamed protein product [Anisakis simplex]
MEPISRIEYQQRHLRGLKFNRETIFLFWMSGVVNVITVVVFYDGIVAFFIDVYARNWGCSVSKRILKRKTLSELQTVSFQIIDP